MCYCRKEFPLSVEIQSKLKKKLFPHIYKCLHNIQYGRYFVYHNVPICCYDIYKYMEEFFHSSLQKTDFLQFSSKKMHLLLQLCLLWRFLCFVLFVLTLRRINHMRFEIIHFLIEKNSKMSRQAKAMSHFSRPNMREKKTYQRFSPILLRLEKPGTAPSS